MARKYLTDEEKLERIKYYEENGEEATAKRYNLKLVGSSIWKYRHSIGMDKKGIIDKDDFVKSVRSKGLIAACIERKITIHHGRFIYNSLTMENKRKKWSYEELLKISEFFAKHTRKETLTEFGITHTQFNAAVKKMKTLGIKYTPDRVVTVVTDEEKLEIVKYYAENGGLATFLKYNIGSPRSIGVMVNHYADDIGYPKPLRYKTKIGTELTKEQKIERIQYYEEHGFEEAAKKYGYVSADSFGSMMIKWSKQTGYQYKLFKRKYYTDSDIIEMVKYLKLNGTHAFEKKYLLDVNILDSIARNRGLLDDTTKIS